MSGTGKVMGTHDVTERISWETQAPLTVRPADFKPFPAGNDWQVEREKMKNVCRACHGDHPHRCRAVRQRHRFRCVRDPVGRQGPARPQCVGARAIRLDRRAQRRTPGNPLAHRYVFVAQPVEPGVQTVATARRQGMHRRTTGQFAQVSFRLCRFEVVEHRQQKHVEVALDGLTLPPRGPHTSQF